MQELFDWCLVIQPMVTIVLQSSPLQYFCFIPEKLCAATKDGKIKVFKLNPKNNKVFLMKVIFFVLR